jgi:hypothetical protein
MMVSDVGRIISGSVSSASGSGFSSPSICFQAVMGDDRHFLGEAVDMLGLLGQEAHRDQQREIIVVVPGVFDPLIQLALDFLPDAKAPRLDDHAAAGGRILGEVSFFDDGLIPVRKILGAGDGKGMRHGGLVDPSRAAPALRRKRVRVFAPRCAGLSNAAPGGLSQRMSNGSTATKIMVAAQRTAAMPVAHSALRFRSGATGAP